MVQHGEVRLAGAANGVALSTTAAITSLIPGTQWVGLTPRNFSTAVVARFSINPYLTVLDTRDNFLTGKGVKRIAPIASNPGLLERFARALGVGAKAAESGLAVTLSDGEEIACDLVIASEEAIFNFAYARIGLSPDGSSTYFLPRHVGMKKTVEIFMTMSTIKAKEAQELSLINWIVPAAELAERTELIAAQLATGPTSTFGRLKKLLNASYDNTLHDQLALESEFICESSKTADFKEGIKSFLEKRMPEFKGK